MENFYNSDAVKYIGVNDRDVDLFESQYKVENGMAYNSYVIIDEKIAVMDSVDSVKTDEWMEKLNKELGGRIPEYIVVLHTEPDHSGSLVVFLEQYPETKIVGNAKTFVFLEQFFGAIEEERKVTVKEGDILSLGVHQLTFYTAAMIHWPEVMVAYESEEGILFSADGFGKFGALDADEEWDCEARRYYFNIVGKYGAQVQALLKKLSALDIKAICPLHGPALTGDLSHYINLYNVWSSYTPEEPGVLVAYASIHGNTAEAAEIIAEKLKAKGVKTALADLCRDDMAEAIEDAFRYDKLVLAASSYDGGLFPPMEMFLIKLKAKAFQKRKVALVENGSWAPSAGKVMKSYLETMKDLDILDNTILIKSSVSESNINDFDKMIEELLQ